MYEAGRQAIRLLRRRPAFCGAVIAIMALSIGSCTAIFSSVRTVLFARLPYAEPERLVIIWHAQAQAAGVVGLSPGDYVTYRDTTRAFESVTAVTTRGYNIGGIGEPARVTCGRATPNLFPMLGVAAWRGRWFTSDEDRTSSRVVILSHQLWRSQFGSDEGLVGRSIMLDAIPYTIIGIMPASFKFPPPGIQGIGEAECWLPTSFTPAEMATPAFDFVVLAKLRPGVSFDQAAADAAAGAQRIWEAYPAAVRSQIQLRARLVPLSEQAVASSRTPLLMFTGSAILLLLIGCANVSNLMLTRLQIRQREMVLRLALGATRAALVKQLLAESVLLAVAGSVCGVLLAKGIMVLTVALSPGNVPRLEEARIDLRTLGFALTCAVLAGVLGGVAPALRSRAISAAGVPAIGERLAAVGFRRDRLRSVLVVLEIALAVVVLTAAGLLARSVVNLNRVTAGFNPGAVLTFSVALPPARYPRAGQIDDFSRAVVERLRQVPTVRDAAAGSGLPIGSMDVAVVSPSDPAPGAPPYRPAAVQTVTPEYHTVLGIALGQGRLLEATDNMSGPPVAVVSESMARTYWPDPRVVGRTLLQIGNPRPLTIVGVVADVHQAGLDRPPIPTFYVPVAQALQPLRALAFVVRTSGDLVQIAPHIRRIVSETDSTLPVFALRTGEDLVSSSIASQRFDMFVVAVFAGIALCLAVMGLYAVMAYSVAQSSREFGIRMAVGATLSGIVRLVVGRALGLLVAGILVGGAVSAGLSQFVASLLFGVQPNDPGTFGLVALLLIVVSGSAVVVPAVRAARVDPVVCLRHE
jgi:putative ABC transport system permease protein